MVKQLLFAVRIHVQPVGRPCGPWMHYVIKDDVIWQVIWDSKWVIAAWNWPKEAMNIPIWAGIVRGIVAGAKMF